MRFKHKLRGNYIRLNQWTGEKGTVIDQEKRHGLEMDEL